ncbi:hypothetical protein AWC38_SpisGene925 [Stylophora pistillata]|uniref:Tyrosine-protein kinase ephrin type A/B receptor-like domain-containing protein n=1 Tax=Stylophora pistillata TaxID=50429 RepID=A0A2B4SYZ5_STYPI|nr:hypothetical protein AWC38_SpisGene925 [Stylophora pistillata]
MSETFIDEHTISTELSNVNPERHERKSHRHFENISINKEDDDGEDSDTDDDHKIIITATTMMMTFYVSILYDRTLSDNPIETIGAEAFGALSDYPMMTENSIYDIVINIWDTVRLNPLDPDRDNFRLNDREDLFLGPTLLNMGFTKVFDHSVNIYRPCPLGTLSKGNGECTDCPPGGFYSDTLGYVAESCKECPYGSYVPFENKPGKSILDCKACPIGTESDVFAGYRACPCLKGFYRTHRFAKCLKCEVGLVCQDDYASLKPGFWWRWRNESYKHRYQDFIQNLSTTSPALDNSSIRYPYSMPLTYRCQVEKSCKGGLDSLCGEGYEGPLCAVCSSEYHKQLDSCEKCPSKAWIVAQLSTVLVILFLLLAFLVWKRRTFEKNEGHCLIDMFFSKLKILVGFYQVTHGLLDVFSYIEWPDSLQAVATYSGILQLNLLQIAPVQCLFSGLHVNAFGELLLILTLNASIIGISGICYFIYKTVTLKSNNLEEDENPTKINQTKQLVYRNLFFFLYVTYLSTFSKTASVLPFACRKLCKDEMEEMCEEYVKADYSVQCQGSLYNHWLILAYISTAYVFALPAASVIVLWKQQRVLLSSTDSTQDTDTGVVGALRFLFENYKPTFWYWELVEMSRKAVLTSGLILVGQDTRSYIGLAWVVAGMYGVLFSWNKPIQVASENRLMSTSLAVTLVNLGIGAVSRIPAENISDDVDKKKDEIVMKVLILAANTLVIGLLVGQYVMFLYEYLKEWRKNPQCSLSCCLALLLPLNDLQGEIRGMVGKNLMKTQLDTGMLGKPSIATTAKDSGAMSFTLSGEDVEQENEVKRDDVVKNNNKKFHRWTQTEAVMPPLASTVEFGSMRGQQGIKELQPLKDEMHTSGENCNAPEKLRTFIKKEAKGHAVTKQKEGMKNEAECNAPTKQEEGMKNAAECDAPTKHQEGIKNAPKWDAPERQKEGETNAAECNASAMQKEGIENAAKCNAPTKQMEGKKNATECNAPAKQKEGMENAAECDAPAKQKEGVRNVAERNVSVKQKECMKNAAEYDAPEKQKEGLKNKAECDAPDKQKEGMKNAAECDAPEKHKESIKKEAVDNASAKQKECMKNEVERNASVKQKDDMKSAAGCNTLEKQKEGMKNDVQGNAPAKQKDDMKSAAKCDTLEKQRKGMKNNVEGNAPAKQKEGLNIVAEGNTMAKLMEFMKKETEGNASAKQKEGITIVAEGNTVARQKAFMKNEAESYAPEKPKT